MTGSAQPDHRCQGMPAILPFMLVATRRIVPVSEMPPVLWPARGADGIDGPSPQNAPSVLLGQDPLGLASAPVALPEHYDFTFVAVARFEACLFLEEPGTKVMRGFAQDKEPRKERNLWSTFPFEKRGGLQTSTSKKT